MNRRNHSDFFEIENPRLAENFGVEGLLKAPVFVGSVPTMLSDAKYNSFSSLESRHCAVGSSGLAKW